MSQGFVQESATVLCLKPIAAYR